MMTRFNRTPQRPASPGALVPLHKRNPQRITITVSWSMHQWLLDRSDQEGRSLSNLAAHLLESCSPATTTSPSPAGPSAGWREAH